MQVDEAMCLKNCYFSQQALSCFPIDLPLYLLVQREDETYTDYTVAVTG
jgi:hypothetical protein